MKETIITPCSSCDLPNFVLILSTNKKEDKNVARIAIILQSVTWQNDPHA